MLKLPSPHRRESGTAEAPVIFFCRTQIKNQLFLINGRGSEQQQNLQSLYLVCLKGFFRLSSSCINACLSIITWLKRNPYINHYSPKTNKQKNSPPFSPVKSFFEVFSLDVKLKDGPFAVGGGVVAAAVLLEERIKAIFWGIFLAAHEDHCQRRRGDECKIQKDEKYKNYQLLLQWRAFFFLLCRKNKPKCIFCKNKRSVLPQSHLRQCCKKPFVISMIVWEMFKK